MPANASKQTTIVGGSDGTTSESLRTNEQGQVTEQHQTGSQTSERTQAEDRSSLNERSGSQTSKRAGTSGSDSTRKQTTDSTQIGDQHGMDTTISERPTQLRTVRESGDGQTTITQEDFAFTISFELEVTGQLSE